jgi:hypothetical protein
VAEKKDWIFLALAHHGLEQRERASDWWAKVRATTPVRARFSWEGVEADLLRHEADACLDPKQPPGGDERPVHPSGRRTHGLPAIAAKS